MPSSIPATSLAAFQCMLIGTWKNPDGDELKKDGRPLSYNVMPLPQVEPPADGDRAGSSGLQYGGFVLKNFSFTEEIRFSGSLDPKDADAGHYDPEALAMTASAPNRGGTYTQSSQALFYDQLVRFAEGPAKGKVVHVENGSWIHFGSEPQVHGPYDTGSHLDGQVLRQPPYVRIAKQIAVPHGNSVLALGSVDLYGGECVDPHDMSGLGTTSEIPGAPVIPDAPPPYPEAKETEPFPEPVGVSTNPRFDPYATRIDNPSNFENPFEQWAINPNYPLQYAVQKIAPARHIHWRVTTRPVLGGNGSVTNVPFEDRKSKVTEYWADYWLLAKEGEGFNYLAYSQTILMEMNVSLDNGQTFRRYTFPHVTTNVVKKVQGSPSDARAEGRDAIKEPKRREPGRKAPDDKPEKKGKHSGKGRHSKK